MAVASSLSSSEGKMNFGANRGSVDIGNAGIQIANGGEGLVHVFRVERRRESVLDAVRNPDSIFQVITRNNRNHRPEDFFLRDAHLRVDIAEYRRLHEPAILIVALVEPLAAAHQLRAFVLADRDVAEVSLQLLLVDRRTHLRGLIQSVADFQLLRAIHVAFDELSVDALLHDDAAGRSTTLAGGAEASPESAFDGQVEVGVVEDDHGILPTKF